MTHRLSSCAAAAHVFNGRTKSVVRRRYQRQRRRSRDDPFDETKKEILRERVVSTYNSIMHHSAPGSEGTGGSFLCFCLLLSLLTKVGRARKRETLFTEKEKQDTEISVSCFLEK